MKKLDGLTFLRVSMGVLMMLHGLMKILGGGTFLQNLGGLPPFVPDVAWLKMGLGTIAMLIELVGGLAIMIGFKVRWASILVVLVMLCAFTYHIQNIHSFSTLMYNTWPLEIAFVFASLAILNPSSKRFG
jgi:putative oxidoreductase